MNKILFLIVFLAGCATGPYEYPNLVKAPAAAKSKKKNYIVWNKKQFLKPKGLVTMSRSTIFALADQFGAENMKPLEGVNGFTVKNAEKPLSITSDEWVVTEEIEYHILQPYTCWKSSPIQCPSEPTPSPNPGPNPSPGPGPTPIEADKSWGRARVHAKEAQALVDTSQVKVCVVDTGIDLNHPNKGNLLEAKDFTGKGTAQDGQGHGTHTAGTVAGNGGVGISRAKLLICKGLSDNGSGTSSALAQCLTWCGQRGAQIVSNSWGSTQSDALINGAINSLTQRGVYVFVAAGNDSGPVNWPAKLAGSNTLVYAIAASDQGDRITSFSSRGPEVRFISPGASIVSNWIGGGFRALDGTSMATPHAAAICAFGIASGKKPCVIANGSVGSYPFADALATAQ